MKRSEELELELAALKEEHRAFRNKMKQESGLADDPNMKWWGYYYRNGGKEYSMREEALEWELRKEKNREIEVGDGATLHLYSDSYACTVIKKTKTTITLQRDKAVLDPDFKPEWIPGGFSAICTNSEDQSYTYERNENGEIYVCHWSEKEGRYRHGSDGSMKISRGRFEHYDYNF